MCRHPRALCLLLLLPLAGCNKSAPAPANVQVQPESADADSDAGEAPGLVARLGDKNPARRLAAVDAIAKLDADGQAAAVPLLVNALKDPAADELGQSHPREAHSTREAAVRALLALGAKGEKALSGEGVPVLREGLRDPKPSVREHTANALALLGPKAAPAADELEKQCADPAREVRRAAYQALEAIGQVPAEPILKLLTNDDPDICSDAAEALRWLRPDASVVPLLLAALTDGKLTDKAPTVGLYVRNASASALGRLGPKAQQAIPALVDMVKKTTDEELRLSLQPEAVRGRQRREETGAMQALRRIGAPTVPALIPLLQDLRPAVRWQAATVLGGIGPKAREALPALQSALEAERDSFPVVAATALAQVQIGGDPAKPVARLTELLSESSSNVRAATAAVLQRFGRRAASAVGKLLPLLEDEEEAVRSAAVEALRATGPAASQAVPALTKKLADENAEVRLGAARAIKGLGPRASAAVPELRKVLAGDDLSLRDEAVAALAAIGPGAKEATPDLARLLGEKYANPNNYLPLIDAVAAIGPGARDAAPALLKLLEEKDSTLRLAAVEALGRVGASGPDVLARLQVAAQRDAFGTVRLAAIRALGEMGPDAKEAAAMLNTLAAGKPGQPRIWAAAALARMGVDAGTNAATVVEALRDATPSARTLRLTAVDAAGLLGPTAGKEAVPDLILLLQDRSPVNRGEPVQVRERAAAALAKLGPAAEPAVPKLAEMLNDGAERVRGSAIEALGRLGPVAVKAADKLRELARTDERLGAAAQEALDRIEPGKE